MSGCEWIIEAHGCDPALLQDASALHHLFARLIGGMKLHPAAESQWHQFPGGGITGLALLQESHIACHTFPEYGSLCLNVFCCRPRPDWNFDEHLRRQFGAQSVEIRKLDRPYQMMSRGSQRAKIPSNQMMSRGSQRAKIPSK